MPRRASVGDSEFRLNRTNRIVDLNHPTCHASGVCLKREFGCNCVLANSRYVSNSIVAFQMVQWPGIQFDPGQTASNETVRPSIWTNYRAAHSSRAFPRAGG